MWYMFCIYSNDCNRSKLKVICPKILYNIIVHMKSEILFLLLRLRYEIKIIALKLTFPALIILIPIKMRLRHECEAAPYAYRISFIELNSIEQSAVIHLKQIFRFHFQVLQVIKGVAVSAEHALPKWCVYVMRIMQEDNAKIYKIFGYVNPYGWV